MRQDEIRINIVRPHAILARISPMITRGPCTAMAGVILALCLQAATCPVAAQSKLDQLEATYQANLRTYHAPVLQEYLRELEALKNQFRAQGRMVDATRVEAEITRIKDISTGTGVLPYTQLEAAMAPNVAEKSPTTTDPAQPPAPAPAATKPAAPALPTLLAENAANSSSLDARTGAMPVGAAQWPVTKLPAGTYDLMILFSSEAMVMPGSLTVSLGGKECRGVIPADRATGSPSKFRLLKLCQVKLDTDLANVTLSLSAPGDKPLMWVKRLMFTVSKAK